MVLDQARGRLALHAVAVGVLAVSAEPVFSALLVWLILAEKPGIPTILGGAVVILGLFLLLRGRRIPVEPLA